MKRLGILSMVVAMIILGNSPREVVASDTGYLVGAGDVLRVTVYDHVDLSTVARVDNNGNILFPLIGSIQVGGLTTSAASQRIADKLNGEFVVNPQVSIFVEEFRSKKVFIIGEVVRPGLYELSGPTSLLELISKAGGLTRGAGSTVTIRRPSPEVGAAETNITIDLVATPGSGQSAADLALYDGDSVTIAKAGVVYVSGQVNRPSAYPLEAGTTVIKAITMAGGFTQLASQKKIRIIRKVDGKEQVMERVSLYEILQPDDVMVVPESFF